MPSSTTIKTLPRACWDEVERLVADGWAVHKVRKNGDHGAAALASRGSIWAIHHWVEVDGRVMGRVATYADSRAARVDYEAL